MNLLLQLGWTLIEATNTPVGTFVGQIEGADSLEPNSSILWNEGDPLSDNDRLTGTVNWNISGYADFGEIWFHIVNRSASTIVFSRLLFQAEGVTGPGSAVFDIPASLWMQITTSGSETDYTYPVNSYEHMGTWQIVATADVVVPPEPEPTQLPWWYCTPETPVVCPVRPTGFVLLADYDNGFKYPLSSSRVASRKAVDGDCTPCTPNLLPSA